MGWLVVQEIVAPKEVTLLTVTLEINGTGLFGAAQVYTVIEKGGRFTGLALLNELTVCVVGTTRLEVSLVSVIFNEVSWRMVTVP